MIRLDCSKNWKLLSIAALTVLMCGGSVRAADVTAITNSSDLDLAGDIVYAVNFSPANPNVEVDGTTFQTFTTSADVAGVTVSPDPIRSFLGTEGFFNQFPALGGDGDVNTVVGSFIDSQDTENDVNVPTMDLGLDVSAGQPYQLQMLFSEGFFTASAERIFDISIEGVLEVDDLDVFAVLGDAGISPDGATLPGAVLVTHEFVAGDSSLDITLSDETSFSVLSGIILEVVPEPSSSLLTIAGLFAFNAFRKRRNEYKR